jgi:hypothetical protein
MSVLSAREYPGAETDRRRWDLAHDLTSRAPHEQRDTAPSRVPASTPNSRNGR